MIRVHFFKPEKVKQHGLEQDCMFVDCLSVEPIWPGEGEYPILELQFGDKDYWRCDPRLIDIIK